MDHARVDHVGRAPCSNATGLNGEILRAERSGRFLLLARGDVLKGGAGSNQQQFLHCLKSISRRLASVPGALWLSGSSSAVTFFQTPMLSVASSVLQSTRGLYVACQLLDGRHAFAGIGVSIQVMAAWKMTENAMTFTRKYIPSEVVLLLWGGTGWFGVSRA